MIYAVHPIALPPTVTVGTAQPSWAPQFSYPRPSLIAFARNGTLAVVTTANGSAAQQIWIFRPGAAREVLSPPSGADLARTLTRFVLNARGEPAFPNSSVQSIALTDDGTPIVNVVSKFTGGYSGSEEASFIRRGRTWRPALARPGAVGAGNRWVAAAQRSDKVAYVVDHLDDFPGQTTPDKALLLDSKATTPLGNGIATAIRATYVTGYDAGFPGLRPLRAFEWTGRGRVDLGPGIAWNVNAAGDVVGDDRSTVDGVGHPTVWHNGHPVRISAHTGSAFAISDAGTIVGAIDDDAFVVLRGDVHHSPQRLDALVRDRNWHISRAFAVASDGTVLAQASRHGGAPVLVLLKPPAGQ